MKFYEIALFLSLISSQIFSGESNVFFARNILPLKIGFKPDLIESIANGAEIAIENCKKVFKWDRWNCPESSFSRLSKQPITKEVAFTQAIISAGVAYAVIRNCSLGNIQECGCAPKPFKTAKNLIVDDLPAMAEPKLNIITEKGNKIGWTWGGCSDNVEYGQMISRKFLDILERGSDAQAQAHLHNNLVGRNVVQETMVKKCRCHGLSGSCSMQTCWMQVAPFATIANNLRQRYNKAKRLNLENTQRLPADDEENQSKEIPKNALVFLTQSPNYCIGNSTTLWAGTKGRTCSRNRSKGTPPKEKRSCRNLCKNCGHRVKKQKKVITKRCKCTFKWCCEVVCQTCTEVVNEYFCD